MADANEPDGAGNPYNLNRFVQAQCRTDQEVQQLGSHCLGESDEVMRFISLWLLIIVLQVFFPISNREFAYGDDWPQWRGPRRDGVWREDGVVDAIPKSGRPVRWRARVLNGWSGPAVAIGRVFITDHNYKNDPEVERVLCFDEMTGKQLWLHEIGSQAPNAGGLWMTVRHTVPRSSWKWRENGKSSCGPATTSTASIRPPASCCGRCRSKRHSIRHKPPPRQLFTRTRCYAWQHGIEVP